MTADWIVKTFIELASGIYAVHVLIATLRWRRSIEDQLVHAAHEQRVARCAADAERSPALMWRTIGGRDVAVKPENAPDLGMACQCRPCVRGRRSLPRATLVAR
jgi:hypothetical protein